VKGEECRSTAEMRARREFALLSLREASLTRLLASPAAFNLQMRRGSNRNAASGNPAGCPRRHRYVLVIRKSGSLLSLVHGMTCFRHVRPLRHVSPEKIASEFHGAIVLITLPRLATSRVRTDSDRITLAKYYARKHEDGRIATGKKKRNAQTCLSP